MPPLEFIQKAIDNAACSIVISDALKSDHPIVYVNRAFTLFTGYSFEETVGQNYHFLEGGDADLSSQEKIQLALQEGTSAKAILSNFRKDGTLFWNELHISPILDDDENVTHFVWVQKDISERLRLEGDLRRLVAIDSLTSALNRHHFFEACEREFKRAKRHGHPTVLLMAEIDHLKSLNDKFGYLAGDEALMCFATTCRDILRSQDILGRISGEGFAILAPETNKAGGFRVGERLRSRISKIFITNEKYSFQFTVSIGGTMCAPAFDTVQISLGRASDALSEAKSANRKQVAWSKDS